ncbi:hypothetical protein ABZ235_33910 [Streptomyces canus]|uniref:hypothetical protein n=1 Tax=Streptomyces canus TaxID=58343 RepID=UPI0033A17148
MSGDDVQITVTVRDETGPGFRSVNHNLNQLQRNANDSGGQLHTLNNQMNSLASSASNAGASLGSSGGGLSSQLIGVGAALGTSLLPAIGAAAPMLAGLGAVGGAAALAMNGLKKQAKELKGPFEEWRKTAEKAVLPHTAKAIDTLKGAMKDLNPVIKTGGESFGRIAEGAAKFADSPAFKGALAKNVQMGSKFFEDFAGSLGKFTQSFLDFGAKSQPSLDAFQNLFGGLLDTGLPGMFKGLETGVGGASKVLDGLAYALNDKLLPGIGKFSGAFAKAFGPFLGESLKLLGDVGGAALNTLAGGLEKASPIVQDFAEGLRGIREFGAAVGPTLADIGSALANSFIPGDIGEGPLQRITEAIERNKGAIQEAARQFGSGVLSIAEMAVRTLPTVVTAFDMMSTSVLTSIDVMVSGAAAAFGDWPLIGDKFKDANTEFDRFKGAFLGGIEAAKNKTEDFAASTLPKLEQNQLKLDINNWRSQIETAEGQLSKVPKSKQAALKATIADLSAKVAEAQRKLNSLDGKTATTWIYTNVKTTYISDVVKGKGSLHDALAGGGRVRGYAGGGNLQHFPDGGYVQGPGTPTSDSIFATFASGAAAAVSDTEYVVKGAAVRKYGVKMLDALNDGKLPVMRLAKGGVTKAEAEARRSAMGDLTVSHFGRAAGYTRSEFASGLGSPGSVSSLVNALNQWRGIILKATHGGQEKSLLRALDSSGKKLLSWEKQLGKVEASLSKAKDKLNSLKDAASQLASSVKSGILSSASITRGASGDGPVTVGSLMSSLTASRDKATAFSSALSQLKGKGLRSDLLQQVADAGIEGGGLETAGALLGASSSEISSINALQAQISGAATSAGKTTADAVYAGQIKAQDALVKKLGAQQDKLTGAMSKLTSTMEKLIERTFKGKAAGGIVGAAAAGGLRSGLTMVGEHGFELLDLPAGSRVWSNPDSRRKVAQSAPWASMLNTPRRTGRGGGASGSGAPEVNVVLEIRGATNSRYEEFLLNELRRAVRVRGGNVQKVLSPYRGH